MIRAAALVAAALPALAAAQALRLGEAREPAGTVLGRVCLDEDGDGRCEPGEPGIAGARLLGSAGAAAVADGLGRYHLLEVPDRLLLPDRSAYGGHALAVEGLGARAAFELAPSGAARVDLAVGAPRASAPPVLSPDPERSGPLAGGGARPRWRLGGRVPPGSRVEVDGAAAAVDAAGGLSAEVALSPGDNRFLVHLAAADGGAAVYRWPVHLARRPDGGALVLPGAPERLLALAVSPARGGGALVRGRVAPGARVASAGVVAAAAADGAFALFVPPGGALELALPGGAVVPVAIEGAPAAGLAAAAGIAEVEVAVLGAPGLLVTARGAGAARGRLGPADFEAGVDVDDRDRPRDLARPRDPGALAHAPDPARTFLTAGDGASEDDRNAARGRLWARVVSDGARLDLGAARAGLVATELGRFDRALFGARAEGEAALGPVELRATAFGATLRPAPAVAGPPAPAHDVLPATGGAVFWLAHGEVVAGSEALRVEWRDPFTGLLAAARPLARGDDYRIDWVTGQVILAAPLATVAPPAALATGEPFAAAGAVLVADYLHATSVESADDLQGGRVAAALGPVAVSAQAANQERAGARYRLGAASATVDLGLVAVRAEAARSRGAPFAPGDRSRSGDGGLTLAPAAPLGREASALHLEARGAAGPARARGWWREREAGYADGEVSEPRAARERGAEVAVDAGPVVATILYAERRGADPLDPAGGGLVDARRAVGRAVWRAGAATLTAEGLHAEDGGAAPGTATSAGARGALRVAPGLEVDLSHHQALRLTGAAVDPTFTALGATLGGGASRLSVRGGWGPALGPRVLVGGERRAPGEVVYGTVAADPGGAGALRDGGSAIGARVRAGAAEVFTEEQLVRDALGLRTARVLGAALEPARGLRLALSGERGQRLRAGGAVSDRSAAGAAVSLSRGPVTLAARGEARDEGGGAAAAALGGSAEWWPGERLALSARTSWSHGTAAGQEALEFEAALGGALRTDALSLLATVARLAEQRPGEPRRDGVLARLALGSAPGARLTVGAGAGIARWRVAGGRDDRLAGSVRAAVRVGGPWDVAGEYARRAPLGGRRIGALDAVRAEAGVSAARTRLALGWTLVGFGGDGLAPADEASRLYLRAQLAW